MRLFPVVVGSCGALLLVSIAFALSQRDSLLQFTHRWRERADGQELAAQLVGPEDVFRYMLAHPEQASMASWEVGREQEGLFLNAERSQPVAAASDLVVLARYARALAQGEHSEHEPVSLADWERHWLPGMDGGAHAAALYEARTSGRVDVATPPAPQVTETKVLGANSGVVRLRDLARAMIRHDDHAATDLLIERYGRAQLQQQSDELGLSAADAALAPFSGLWLSWLGQGRTVSGAELIARYRALGPFAYAQLTWSLAGRLARDGMFRSLTRTTLEREGSRLSLLEQAQLVDAFSPRGTARSYAALMQRVVSAELPGSETMREHLEWPLESPATRSDFEVFATKRGSLPGMSAAVCYARSKGGARVKVLALFFQKLPLAVWLQLSESVLQQRLVQTMLQDEDFFVRAKQCITERDAACDFDAVQPRHAQAD
jgi:Beta-lactamase enzyme family